MNPQDVNDAEWTNSWLAHVGSRDAVNSPSRLGSGRFHCGELLVAVHSAIGMDASEVKPGVTPLSPEDRREGVAGVGVVLAVVVLAAVVWDRGITAHATVMRHMGYSGRVP